MLSTPGRTAADSFFKYVQLLARVRVPDAIIGMALTTFGITLYIPSLSASNLVLALLLSLGSFFVMAHIFALNDWADAALDRENAEKRANSLLEKGIAARDVLLLACGLGLAGIAIISVAKAALLPIVLAMMGLGIAYSVPLHRSVVKGMPILSSVMHFAGGVLAFLLGSTAFAQVDAAMVLLGSYGAILIVAGHLIQEVQDAADDSRGGIRTSAVQFGPAPVFGAALILFGVSFIVLYLLARAGLVPAVGGYAVVLFPLVAFWGWGVLRSDLASGEVRRFRRKYRALFAALMLVLLAGALLEKLP